MLGPLQALLGRRQDGTPSQEEIAQIEALLLRADLGPQTTEYIIAHTKQLFARSSGREEFAAVLKSALRDNMLSGARALVWDSFSPTVFCVAGVNGSGKTTTIGKLAHRLRRQGRSVVVGACDTFRAAAADQLAIWTERADAFLLRSPSGADPASVAYRALEAGISRKADVVLLDTAGRLHTKSALMDEAKKITRVLKKLRPQAPSETLLVLDATNGQNALVLVGEFHAALNVTGIVLAKMDAGSKAGIAVALERTHKIPVKFVGTGEALEDLEPFDPDVFVEALVGEEGDSR